MVKLINAMHAMVSVYWFSTSRWICFFRCFIFSVCRELSNCWTFFVFVFLLFIFIFGIRISLSKFIYDFDIILVGDDELELILVSNSEINTKSRFIPHSTRIWSNWILCTMPKVSHHFGVHHFRIRRFWPIIPIRESYLIATIYRDKVEANILRRFFWDIFFKLSFL